MWAGLRSTISVAALKATEFLASIFSEDATNIWSYWSYPVPDAGWWRPLITCINWDQRRRIHLWRWREHGTTGILIGILGIEHGTHDCMEAVGGLESQVPPSILHTHHSMSGVLHYQPTWWSIPSLRGFFSTRTFQRPAPNLQQAPMDSQGELWSSPSFHWWRLTAGANTSPCTLDIHRVLWSGCLSRSLDQNSPPSATSRGLPQSNSSNFPLPRQDHHPNEWELAHRVISSPLDGRVCSKRRCLLGSQQAHVPSSSPPPRHSHLWRLGG